MGCQVLGARPGKQFVPVIDTAMPPVARERAPTTVGVV